MKEKIETLRQTTFIMAAKSNVGMVRDNNEDNFQVSSSLDREPMSWMNNELCELSPRGALLVVADGMGGMNAGEVASEIAIETLKDIFTPQNITDEVIKNRYTVERFMNSVITEADNRIKQTAKKNPATKGMGTTMVMGWVLENSLYVSWAGDSRAYVFNPLKGLKRLSKDHSLVQELVDSGKISKEDAFDYPDSNVITNCLSAVSQKAVPEAMAMPHKLEEGDIILLCSDGLCGLIRDTDIQGVISQNQDDMTACCDALIKAACDAGGHDNVTVALCKIVTLKDGGADEDDEVEENFGRKTWIRWGGITLAVLAVAFCVWWFGIRDTEPIIQPEESPIKEQTNNTATTEENVLPDAKVVKKTIGNEKKSDNVTAKLDKFGNLHIDVFFEDLDKTYIKIEGYGNDSHYENGHLNVQCNNEKRQIQCEVIDNKNTDKLLSCTLKSEEFEFYFKDVEIGPFIKSSLDEKNSIVKPQTHKSDSKVSDNAVSGEDNKGKTSDSNSSTDFMESHDKMPGGN